ncbi:MAG TPA: response regulator [Bacteroidetes bacterium]|nr:response regulator [Bacteroidota bacterium]
MILPYGLSPRRHHEESDSKFMSQKILVAEDQQHIRSLIEYKLTNSGYTVVCAEDGKSALEKAGQIIPDLILLDVMMPLMTGFEVLAALKTDEKTRNIPILMVTAQSKENEVLKGLELGADDYITKPFSPNELAARVKNILMRRKRGT